MATTLQTVTTRFVEAANGVKFAYRRLGQPAQVPLVMHIHFRANMDLWDPLLVNTLADHREVIIFDNAGIGRSNGEVKSSYQEWADDLISFVQALQLGKFDLLGFSMGGIAVQRVALTVPDMVRKLIIAGSRATAPVAHHDVDRAATPRDPPPNEPITRLRLSNGAEEERDSLCFSFFPQTEAGREHFENYWARINERNAEPLNLRLLDVEKAGSQVAAAKEDSAQAENPDFLKSYTGRTELTMPVLVANGDNDTLIPTSRSWELLTKVKDAQLIIYPNAGHGFIWQYAQWFAQDINRFLDGPSSAAKL
ncbi:hypothetical protein H2198_001113 [Neophaeococcomyces mojaviensis]|uniref:Uncharacterized protein n=1 Tax=Neophaeococcomyces mojaviensis TaxID=3383035 RepID=A0ACC3AII4_9EURO|nr:hypothetical protein H2198_001113 [Knufia sp. JES_112]